MSIDPSSAERQINELLSNLPGIEVLPDRRVPHSRSRLGPLVVAPAGVFVVDTCDEPGRVELRHRDGVMRREPRLFVNGYDRTPLVDRVLDQMEAVRRVLDIWYPSIDVHGVLCLVDGQWGAFKKPKRVRGVTSVWPAKLPELVMSRGPFASLVSAVTFHLGEYLPAAA